MALLNAISYVERIKKIRGLFTRPRTYVAWHGERFAIFLTTDGVNEIKRSFVGIGGAGDDVIDRTEQAKLVRCREIPLLGHRPTWTDELIATGCIFASWKYSNSGKVWGWNGTDRERSQNWMLHDGPGVKS